MTFEMYKDQTEAEIPSDLPKEGIRVAVKILKLDEQRVCVEFKPSCWQLVVFLRTILGA